jgi:hypothetical protein
MKNRMTSGLGSTSGVVLLLLLAGCAKTPAPKTATPSPAPDALESPSAPAAQSEDNALLLGGGCQTADLCSAEVCRERQNRVHPTCDVQRSCSGNVTSAEAQRRLTINQNCLAVREAVAECYSEQDSGHRQQIESVERAIETCEGKI